MFRTVWTVSDANLAPGSVRERTCTGPKISHHLTKGAIVTFGNELLAAVCGDSGGDRSAPELRHLVDLPARSAEPRSWPGWASPEAVAALRRSGVDHPWSHQVEAAELARCGHDVVISTGTASGKSLAFQLPILDCLARDPRSRALYLAPTKALGHEQLRKAQRLTEDSPILATICPASYDGDTPVEIRQFARERARWLFSNPDMMHTSLMRNHRRWSSFLRCLRFVVVDECHYYRGIFGSNVALVLRRLLRLCAHYSGPDSTGPTVIFASATTACPGDAAEALIGRPVAEVTHDGSPHGGRTIALWEPRFLDDMTGENDAPLRRSAGAEAARMMADLVAEGARTMTFVRSRRGAELTALGARERLADTAPHLCDTVASYRAGYLAEDRRELEHALAEGHLRGLATTNALELGIDIAGLDAVLLAGFPGTVTSFWQQAGRSGRRGQGALVVLIARDDPLDTYLVNHPDALLGKPVERVVIDPANPYVAEPQLLCAAAEIPLHHSEVIAWGLLTATENLVDDGLLRRRGERYFPTPGSDPHDHVDIRGSAAGGVTILEESTGRVIGSTEAARAPATVHPGAVYLHQGNSYLVDDLDLGLGLAYVRAADPGYTTFAREVTQLTVTGEGERVGYGAVTLGLVPVSVTHRVIGYVRRGLTGEIIDFVDLDMPERQMSTSAVMYTIAPAALHRNGITPQRVPGSLHAAEHAAIGLLPLVASCDRSDVGGLSTAAGESGFPTVFVYDGHPGGAGFAERGYRSARTWLGATAEAIAACECRHGCPSCVQSPKCGNGNDPLDKGGAVEVLRLLLRELDS